jgi:hypothetical protein
MKEVYVLFLVLLSLSIFFFLNLPDCNIRAKSIRRIIFRVCANELFMYACIIQMNIGAICQQIALHNNEETNLRMGMSTPSLSDQRSNRLRNE